jgi:bacterioferritin-associated ferredoxin
MIVCVCANVSERELRATIDDGATTVKEIGRRCGAGAGCGECRSAIRDCLREHRAVLAACEGERAFPGGASPDLAIA